MDDIRYFSRVTSVSQTGGNTTLFPWKLNITTSTAGGVKMKNFIPACRRCPLVAKKNEATKNLLKDFFTPFWFSRLKLQKMKE